MVPTKIEWTNEVWNPVHGCTPVSAGCANCYAKHMSRRLAGRHGYPPNASECPVCGELFKQFVAFCPEHANETLIRHSSFDVTLRPDRLEQPLRWHKSKMIFVCSMGDLFHESIPDAFIAGVLKTIHQASWHVFQILTKRPQRALDFIQHFYGAPTCFPDNVWFGVSVENQQAADELIPLLLQTPAAVRFVSCEPLLGRVDVEKYLLSCNDCGNQGSDAYMNYEKSLCRTCIKGVESSSLDWLIVGAETGPGARPMHPNWARSLHDQAQEAGVPFFMKQMSGKAPIPDGLMIREFPK